jgi:2-polyprenyl-3-methyl-5-hydroxy-6-metoxy-1,4-benzoquinol methylase
MFDATYELTRTPPEPVLFKKLRLKRFLYKLVGEIYVGRRVKMTYFREILSNFSLLDGGAIMDAGSGDGVFAFEAARRYPHCRVVGLELNRTEVRVCQEIARAERIDNLTFLEGVPESIEADNFDLIYCLDVLEHIKDDVAAVKAMVDRLKPGGRLLVHVPNRFIMQTDGSLVTVPDEEAHLVNPGHVRQGYTPAQLGELLAAAGLHVDEIRQTQGLPIARARQIYRAVERFLPLRILILPAIDLLTWFDRRRGEPHGNAVWAIGSKPF